MTKPLSQQDRETIKSLILESRTATPGRLSELLVELSSWAFLLGERLGELDTVLPDKWLELREGAETNGMTDRLLDASPEGKEHAQLKYQTKYLDKVIGSIHRRLKVKSDEAWNRY